MKALVLIKEDQAQDASVAVIDRKRKQIVLATVNPETKKVYAIEEEMLVQRGFNVKKKNCFHTHLTKNT